MNEPTEATKPSSWVLLGCPLRWKPNRCVVARARSKSPEAILNAAWPGRRPACRKQVGDVAEGH